jgi:MFS family permease
MDAVPEESKLMAAVIVFAGATVIGVVDIAIHGTIPEPRMVKSANRRTLHDLLEPFRDAVFRPWLIFNGFWTFSMTLGGALATIYFIRDLGIKDNFLGGTIVLTSFSLLGSIFSGGWSGRLVDKLGSRRILFMGHVFWALLPAFWFLSSPQYALVWLGLGSLVGGTSSTAASSASSKLITRTPPPDKRASYAAASSTLGSLAGGLGIIVAGTILRLLDGWSFQIANLTIGPFRLLFLVSCVLRLSSALIFIPRLRDGYSSAGASR